MSQDKPRRSYMITADGIWRSDVLDTNAEIYAPCLIVNPSMVKIDDTARIDSMTKLEGGLGLTIGKGVHIASFSHVGIGGGEVVIGDYAGLAGGCKILSGSNTQEGYAMSAAAPAEMQVIKRSKTVIGPRAFIGVNAVIMYGVTIGEGAVIGAGAVVTKDVPEGEIWAGVPARKIGERKHVEAPEMVLAGGESLRAGACAVSGGEAVGEGGE